VGRRVGPIYSEADFEKVRVLDEQVAELHPDLKAIYDDNVNAEEGYGLVYIAMSEYTFWATAHADSHFPVVQRMIQMLESAYRTGEDIIEECISVMFLENLIGEPQMISRLAPSLRRQMGRILGEWSPG
jgi:hypothetical protein